MCIVAWSISTQDRLYTNSAKIILKKKNNIFAKKDKKKQKKLK